MGLNSKKKILVGVGVFVILVSVWYLFFSYESCNDIKCFEDNLEKCDRAKFVNQGNMTLKYEIIGKKGDYCVVNVKFLTGKLENSDINFLEGKEMSCSIPLGIVISPESSLESCHGELREGLQELVISRLHRYIVQNIGKINADLFNFG